MAKRTNRELQKYILNTIKNNNLTINEISSKSNIYWPNVKHQLILLKGMDYVSEVFRHKRLRVFGITKEGKKYLRKL